MTGQAGDFTSEDTDIELGLILFDVLRADDPDNNTVNGRSESRPLIDGEFDLAAAARKLIREALQRGLI